MFSHWVAASRPPGFLLILTCRPAGPLPVSCRVKSLVRTVCAMCVRGIPARAVRPAVLPSPCGAALDRELGPRGSCRYELALGTRSRVTIWRPWEWGSRGQGSWGQEAKLSICCSCWSSWLHQRHKAPRWQDLCTGRVCDLSLVCLWSDVSLQTSSVQRWQHLYPPATFF